jgi:hypothetical protein
MTLGGNGESASGQTNSPSTFTSYSVTVSGHDGVVMTLHGERPR